MTSLLEVNGVSVSFDGFRAINNLSFNIGETELRAVIGEFRESARKMPPLMPHFGVRYRSSAELEAVTDRIANGLSPALKDRVSLFEVPHYDPVEGLPDIRQVFVTTDVFTIGTAGFEQAIELQVDRARP